MARLVGVDLPRNKRLEVALTYIYGIGPARSKKILEKTGISPDLRTDDLTEDDIRELRNALSEYNIYVEIICDSMHVSDEVLRITFRQKSLDKILLISDALPLAHSNIKEARFSGQIIYNENGKLVNKDGTMAGSSSLLCDIIKNLSDKNILSFENAIKCASSNIEQYHNIQNTMNIYWTDDYKIQKVEFN